MQRSSATPFELVEAMVGHAGSGGMGIIHTLGRLAGRVAGTQVGTLTQVRLGQS